MSVSICVPLMLDGAERNRNWDYVRSRYERLYPDWEIVTGECDPPWRKGLALHRAIEKTSGDVLVISDADVLIQEQALRTAVERLQDVPWVVPHRRVFRLNEDATRALIASEIWTPTLPRRNELQRIGGSAAGGGISVMSRQGWDTVGGVDARFEGWGGEDLAFAYALDTMLGRHLNLNEPLFHLFHEAQPTRPGRRGSEESEALANRYLHARGDPVAMQDLIEEHHKGMEGGGIVVARREVAQSIPIDPAFAGWG